MMTDNHNIEKKHPKPLELVRLQDFHSLRDLLWKSGAAERDDVWLKRISEYKDEFFLKVDLLGPRTGSRFYDWLDLLIFKLWILGSRRHLVWKLLEMSWVVIGLMFILTLGFCLKVSLSGVPPEVVGVRSLSVVFAVTFLAFVLWSWILFHCIVRWVSYLNGGNDLAMSADPFNIGRLMFRRRKH